MATPEQLDAAMQSYRDALAVLHEMAEQRDYYARKQVPRMIPIEDMNAQIAAQRAVVQQSRTVLAQMLAESQGSA